MSETSFTIVLYHNETDKLVWIGTFDTSDDVEVVKLAREECHQLGGIVVKGDRDAAAYFVPAQAIRRITAERIVTGAVEPNPS